MRTLAFGLMTLAMISACGNAEPAASMSVDPTVKTTPLSISADLMLTNLAVASPKPLSAAELCDNVGICDEEQTVAARELLGLGFVTPPTKGSYQLTEAGQRYLRDNYKIVRDGDRTIVETRDENTN
jgi:hypothetical protein